MKTFELSRQKQDKLNRAEDALLTYNVPFRKIGQLRWEIEQRTENGLILIDYWPTSGKYRIRNDLMPNQGQNDKAKRSASLADFLFMLAELRIIDKVKLAEDFL